MRSTLAALLGVAATLSGPATTVWTASATTVNVQSSDPLSDVGDNFQGFTTDYWLNEGPYSDKWFPNGSILLVDLEDPKFRALVQVSYRLRMPVTVRLNQSKTAC
jgi:hypothetical protein